MDLSGNNETLQKPDPFGTRLPLSMNLRIKLGLTGIIFPGVSIISALSGATASIGDPWQSGNLETYVVLFLQPYGLKWFLPYIAISALALVALIFKPVLIRSFWVRAGMYTGAIVSLQFSVAVLLATSIVSPIAAAIVGPCLAVLVWSCSETIKRVKRFTILHLMIATFIVAIFLAVCAATDWQPMGFVVVPLMGIFFAAPTLNFVTYMRMAFLSAKHETIHRQPIAKISAAIFAVVMWLGGFVLAWRQAVDRVLLEYQNLPTTSPNCFIASAAAYGDPRLVGAEPIDANGHEVMLNQQMQRLKFLELALQSALPRCHAALRRIYNRLGPKLARCCQRSRGTANISYLMLKPAEWTAEIVRSVAGVSAEQIRRIYRG